MSISEVNMSIDDSLIISSDVLNEVFDQQSEQASLNNTIEQFEPCTPAERLTIPIQHEPSTKIVVQPAVVVGCAIVNSKEIVQQQVAKQQETILLPPQQQQNHQKENKPLQKLTLNIQQIIDQVKKPNVPTKLADQKVTNDAKPKNKTSEVEMNAEESLRSNDSQTIQQIKVNTSTKSNEADMSVDESLILCDIRNIFETSSSSTSEFVITKPVKKVETPKRQTTKNSGKESEMDMSCSDANDSLVLKEVKIVNNPKDCLDESPYLKSLPPPKQVFKLSRKRLNCDLESPNHKKPHFSNNLFKSHLNTTPLTSVSNINKKWRSATYNPMTSSPKKMELGSPLKPIDSNIIGSNNFTSTIDNLLISNLNMMIQKSDQLPDLMGDYSNTYVLPSINGRHKDLKTISPETLLNLMDGKYCESIDCFTIVDSRYPYEYEGGHIDGSKNIYRKEDINSYFFGTEKPTLITDKKLIKSKIEVNSKQSSSNSMQRHQANKQTQNNSIKRLGVIKEGSDENYPIKTESSTNQADKPKSPMKRHAIIFHCEFSSERGPSMYRHLRKVDRELNESCYPNLYYPEIYLLHGGYKMFFEKFKDHCFPQTYLPMADSEHKDDYMKFKKKSKTWNSQHSFSHHNKFKSPN